MPPTIAIQSDRFTLHNGISHRFSDRWIDLCNKKGWSYELVDVNSTKFVDRIMTYDAFLWRVGSNKHERAQMRHLAQIFETYTDTPIYPSSRTLLTHSKIDQVYMCNTLGVATPKTLLFRKKSEALDFLETAIYPVVIKLDFGNQSRNVALVHDAIDAKRIVSLIFDDGLKELDTINGDLVFPSRFSRFVRDRLKPAIKMILGFSHDKIVWGEGAERGYFYVQEYVHNNLYDTRITIIGNKAFGFTRANRKDDFRASGSGFVNWDPALIDKDIVRIAFDIAGKMGTQTNAMDFIYKDNKPVLLECNLSFAAWAINLCPGFWLRNTDDSIVWLEQRIRVEDLIFDEVTRSLN